MNDSIIALAEKERDEFLRSRSRIQAENTIPPGESQGLSVAETNIAGISWQDFINQEDANPEPWLIDGLLRSGWLVVLGGHGKHGKSTLAIHLLNCLRMGQKFVNQCSKVPVIYFNYEMAPQDAKELIKDITNSSSIDGESAQIINQPKTPLDLSWLQSLLAKQEKPGVCVIDSFRGAFMLSGDTENQAGTVGGILRHLQLIARKTKWAIVLIHHFRKSGTGEALDLAGSGEWLSAPDAIFTWSCSNFKEPGTLNVLGRLPPCEPLSIQLSRTHIEFLGTTKSYEAESERTKILSSLSTEGSNSDELARQIELPPSTIRRRLDELYKLGKVEREGEGKRGSPFVWKTKLDTLTPTG